MFTLALYLFAFGWLGLTYLKDRQKARAAVTKCCRSFFNIFPDFAAVLLLVGLMLTFLAPETIARLIGKSSGAAGMFLTSVLGAITLIPGFVAFPLAASLLKMGAGIAQIAVFISTLMTVGVVTAPLEAKYFCWREVLWRNGLNYLFAFFTALVIVRAVGA